MSPEPSPPIVQTEPLHEARNRLFWTIVGLFVAASLAFALRGTLTSNELDTLQTARRWADPDWIPGDWFLSTAQGPRRPFQVLISPLVAALPLPWVSLVGRLFGYLFVAIATARLTVRLNIGATFVLAAGGVFILQGQSFATGEWVIGQIESKVVAYGLVLLGIRAWLDGKRVTMGAIFGAATTIHVLVGAQATFALLLALLFERPLRRHLPTLVAWTALALPGLAIALNAARDNAVSTPPMSWIYVVFRAPHHMDPTAWRVGWRGIAWAIALVAVLVVTLIRDKANIDKCRLARFGLAALVPFVAGLVAALFPQGHKFLQFFPFRVGSLILPLSALMLGVAWVEQKLPPRWVRSVGFVGAIVTLSFSAVSFQKTWSSWRAFPEGGRLADPDQVVVATWLRDHGPAGGVLASPIYESIGYLSRRPVVCTYGQVPPNRTDVVNWYQRIVDLSGGAPLSGRGFAVMPELDKHFEDLSPSQLQDIAKRYQMTVLLTRQTKLDWPLLSRRGVWSAYAIPQ